MRTLINHKHSLARADHQTQGPRIVLLGASNVSRLISPILGLCYQRFGRPFRVLTALGHGRSYGVTSSVLMRSLPPINKCGLWDALAEGPSETFALVTDIGNDILYGSQARKIARWVAQVLDKLQGAGAEVVLTRLPVANLETLDPRWFVALRTVYFPTCRLSLRAVQQQALQLNHHLTQLAADRGLILMDHSRRWYGWDPLHIQRRAAWEAYGRWFDNWRIPPHLVSNKLEQACSSGHPFSNNSDQKAEDLKQYSGVDEIVSGSAGLQPGLGYWRWLQLKTSRPQQVWFARIPVGEAQPALHWPDGTTVAFY